MGEIGPGRLLADPRPRAALGGRRPRGRGRGRGLLAARRDDWSEIRVGRARPRPLALAGASSRARQGPARPARPLPAARADRARARVRDPRSSGCPGSAASTATPRGARSSSASSPAEHEDLLCHELCHVWQMQHHPVAMPLSYLRSGYAREPVRGGGAAGGRGHAWLKLALGRREGRLDEPGAPAAGRLRQRRAGHEVPGTWSATLEWLVRRSRRAPAASGSSRCATGSSPGARSTSASRTAAGRDRGPAAERVRCSSASRWAGRSRSRPPATARRAACSGSRRGSPTGSTSRRCAGKRLDVLHGSLDRWLPGVPGVSPALSRRGFERARALGRAGAATPLIRGGVHGLALRSPGGRPRAAAARRALGAARRRSARGVAAG